MMTNSEIFDLRMIPCDGEEFEDRQAAAMDMAMGYLKRDLVGTEFEDGVKMCTGDLFICREGYGVNSKIVVHGTGHLMSFHLKLKEWLENYFRDLGFFWVFETFQLDSTGKCSARHNINLSALTGNHYRGL